MRAVLTGTFLALVLTLVAATARSAAPAPSGAAGACSAEDARKAETAAASPRAWAQLHDAFRRHAPCDDGAVARGFSDTVVRLLATEGGSLPELIAICVEDDAFQGFVARHADESVNTPALWKALTNVRRSCPQHVGVCEDLEYMLEQSGAARSTRSSSGFRSIVRAAGGVIWSPPLAIDVDGDGAPDTVALGRTSTQAVLGIARAARPATADVIRLPPATAPEGKGCGPPTVARVLVESPPPAEDGDAPAAAKAPVAPGAKPFRVEVGDCDAFHFYFDGRQVTAWRR